MRRRQRDELGLVGVILTIVIVWALLAVLLLTRTLIAAQDINHTVVAIRDNVKGAENHLNTACAPSNCPTQSLPILVTTVNLAQQINTAAAPLTGQLAQVKMDTASINSLVGTILTSANSINTTVQSIHSLVLSIGSTVGTIHSTFVSINSDVVGHITPGLTVANTQQVATIESDVNAIKANTDIIDGQAKGILVQAKEICADTLLVVGVICHGG
jgi:hypothetical protein